jgi:putative endonuclease
MSRRLGDAAEQQAAAFLERNGYRIVARNVCARGGELDIVAVEAGVLVFVEVRARSSARWGGAAETVGAVKQRRLALAAETFLLGWKRPDMPCRFDVVAVEPGPRFTLIKDAFQPG